MIDELKSNVMVSIAKQMRTIKVEVAQRFPGQTLGEDAMWDLLEQIMLRMYTQGFDDAIDASTDIISRLKDGRT